MQPLFASDFSGIGEAFLVLFAVGALLVAAVSLPIAALVGRRYGKRMGFLIYPAVCVATALVIFTLVSAVRIVFVVSANWHG